MDKKLQDLAWACLPREFREEVKKYLTHYRYALNTHEAIINHIFGKHNLTSDADGEEMLCVSRKRVQELYMNNSEKIGRLCDICNADEISKCDARCGILLGLFGSKCLPDGTKDDTKEPKPAEPKFKVGDKVIYKKTNKQMVANHCAEFKDYDDVYLISTFDGRYPKWVKESDLEPYTEPDTSHEMPVLENHSDDTSQKEVNESSNRNLSQNIVDCDKQLDNILKDSFHNERRLTIAAMIESSLIANPDLWKPYRGYGQSHAFAKLSLEFADALMSECEKGGKK